MSRRRFFVSEVRRGSAELTGVEAEHLVRVLRAEPGQIYELSDNHDLYLAEIETARKSLVSFRVLEKLALPAPAASICLMPAIFKFDRFEWLVEKAVELGVSAISPFEAARTEHGLAAAALKRKARWEKIALEASQQSRRAKLPIIDDPVRFSNAIAVDTHVKILLDEAASTPVITTLPSQRSMSDRIALMIGPEGGWTDEERAQAIAHDWKPSSLAPTVLRAETAAIAGLAVLQSAWLGK